jgi:hypothetical protein
MTSAQKTFAVATLAVIVAVGIYELARNLKPHVPRRQPVSQANNNWVVSDSDSADYVGQLSRMATGERNRYTGDARNLRYAIMQYAAQHDAQMPSTFADIEPYKYQGKLPLGGTFKERDTMAGTNDFEIVYRGSLNQLTNDPRKSIALLRQRQPWSTPHGEQARIYLMNDTRVFVVESGDNFVSWESEHLVNVP